MQKSILIAAVLAAIPVVTQAANIVSNLAAATTGEVASGATIYQSFAMGNTAASLGTVTLRLATTGNEVQNTVSLYANSNGTPGSSLATTGAVGVSDEADYTFTFASPVTQNANTTYWIADDQIASTFWVFAGSNAVGTSDLGVTLGNFYDTNVGSSPDDKFKVGLTTPVPEPASLGLPGAGAVVMLRRNRSRGL